MCERIELTTSLRTGDDKNIKVEHSIMAVKLKAEQRVHEELGGMGLRDHGRQLKSDARCAHASL